ncbi:GyrI-like domain-containing protein [Aliiroseovarius subalbicans]|uniref:GyrI-like domain-containing protein n=1 Tax=Aliiroseovarius subalbicans TaxID=2925840 RepID=UPI001F5AEE4F|nr:GyrI-like domain-containing protein [Aliiroseovarius subalbicans]MCI2399701.1 GyrI-like domain-containing protein [Aliiroseovarius subalbicans]
MTNLPDPQIVTRPQRHFVGAADTFTMETRYKIPALYERFFGSGWQIENTVTGALYGLSFDTTPDGFRYAVAVEVDPLGTVPDGACSVEAAAGTYAVFRNRGPVADLPAMFDAIFSTWLPNSDHEQAEGVVFEAYPDDPDAKDGVMTYEIWVPLKG